MTDRDRLNNWQRNAQCDHEWTPLNFVFETRIIDQDGRPRIFQPALENARVYCVCMKCHGHTYIETNWTGYRLNSAYEVAEQEAGEEDEDR